VITKKPNWVIPIYLVSQIVGAYLLGVSILVLLGILLIIVQALDKGISSETNWYRVVVEFYLIVPTVGFLVGLLLRVCSSYLRKKYGIVQRLKKFSAKKVMNDSL
jgi:hypothetical protein